MNRKIYIDVAKWIHNNDISYRCYGINRLNYPSYITMSDNFKIKMKNYYSTEWFVHFSKLTWINEIKKV